MYKLKAGVSINCFGAREIPNGHQFFLRKNFEESLREVKKAGFYSIELAINGLWKKSAISDYLDAFKDLVALVKSYGLVIDSVHMPFGALVDLDFTAPIEEQRVSALKHAVLICEKLKDANAHHFTLHPGIRPTPEDRDIRISQLIKSMNEIVKMTDAKICVENMTNDSLLNTSEEAKRVLDNSPMEMVIDLNHMLKETPQNYLKTVGKRVQGLHVSDRKAEKECHYLPGKGVLDYQDIIKTLEEINYKGVFTYEVGFGKGYNLSAQDIMNNYNALFAEYNR